jgi:hypothetical protein
MVISIIFQECLGIREVYPFHKNPYQRAKYHKRMKEKYMQENNNPIIPPVISPGDYNITYNEKYSLEKLKTLDTYKFYKSIAFDSVIFLFIFFLVYKFLKWGSLCLQEDKIRAKIEDLSNILACINREEYGNFGNRSNYDVKDAIKRRYLDDLTSIYYFLLRYEKKAVRYDKYCIDSLIQAKKIIDKYKD